MCVYTICVQVVYVCQQRGVKKAEQQVSKIRAIQSKKWRESARVRVRAIVRNKTRKKNRLADR